MNMTLNFIKSALLLFACAFSHQAVAQKYEAENATLSGGATRQTCASCSGGFFVAQGEGKLTFDINIPETAFYNISIRAAAPNGEKTNIIAVNSHTSDFYLARQTQYATFKLVNTVKLNPGRNIIEIRKSWGWINIDFIELEKVNANERFNLNQTLVHPDPLPEAKALYDFLLDQYGQKIISGAMTLDSLDEAIWLKQQTGKEPALLGIDFMHSGRGYNWYKDKMPIINARTWYERNGIPALMWHWRDPSRKTEEFYTKNTSKPNGTDFDISKVSDVNSAEYRAMLSDIDYVSGLLKELQQQGVPVLWRPLHEAAGGWFWWGAKGPEPCRQLYLLMYDRMVNYHGLRNLIWIWTREPGDEAWYPGDNVVDIVGRDIYKDGDFSSHVIEFNNLNALYSGKKMISLSEVGSFPDPDNLQADGAAWSWFMPWYGAYTRDSRYNSLAHWHKTMNHAYVLTLNEMPALKTYQKGTGPTSIHKKLLEQLSLEAYPTVVEKELQLKGEKPLKTIEVYNTQGRLLKTLCPGTTETTVSFSTYKPGLYLVKINGTIIIKVLKN